MNLIFPKNVSTATIVTSILNISTASTGSANPRAEYNLPQISTSDVASAAKTDQEHSYPWFVESQGVRVFVPSITSSSSAQFQIKIAELIARLDQLRTLDDGWDGDGAAAPSNAALTSARDALHQLGRLPDEIDADAIGGIALWFYSNCGRQVMIGIRNRGRVVVCTYSTADAIPNVAVARDLLDANDVAKQALLLLQ